MVELKDWLDLKEAKHIVAFYYYYRNGEWPECFLPADVRISEDWLSGLVAGMNFLLSENFIEQRRIFINETRTPHRLPSDVARVLATAKLVQFAMETDGVRVLRTSRSIFDRFFHRFISRWMRFAYEPDALLIFTEKDESGTTITYLSITGDETDDQEED